jgi:hypothetical protein
LQFLAGGPQFIRRVKILIRDTSRNLYLGPGGVWVKNIADARAFMLGHAAIDHIIKEKLTGVDLYCVFRNTAFNTAIPLMAYQRLDASGRDQSKVSKASPVSLTQPGTPTSAKPSNPRVLLVEDDPDDVHMLITALRTELACDVVVTFTRQVFEMELKGCVLT